MLIVRGELEDSWTVGLLAERHGGQWWDVELVFVTLEFHFFARELCAKGIVGGGGAFEVGGFVEFLLGVFALAPDEGEGAGDVSVTVIEPIHASDGGFLTGLGVNLGDAGVIHVLGDELAGFAVVGIANFVEKVAFAVVNFAGKGIPILVHVVDGGGDDGISGAFGSGDALFGEGFLVAGAAVFGGGAVAVAHDSNIVAYGFPDFFFESPRTTAREQLHGYDE